MWWLRKAAKCLPELREASGAFASATASEGAALASISAIAVSDALAGAAAATGAAVAPLRAATARISFLTWIVLAPAFLSSSSS